MDDIYTPSERRGYRRLVVAGIILLLGLGLFPATAAVLDSSQEDWILPLYVVIMVVVGVLLWTFIPAVTDGPARTGRRAMIGAAAGLASAAVTILVFFALLNGFSGA